eukprot:Gregarina_sp_Poly_1__10557@NODE_781_length_6314_cov_28_558028_g573_i0_p1_GENE_NODE_781_length_6314_cov_28_558028_g573_i0NODE_781_length_6314_cov_28_558028_g573_i0_p1_ORF_typecomplete_len316_score14_08_NODE_781_length_6314_cov_28_558028_g573_i01031050
MSHRAHRPGSSTQGRGKSSLNPHPPTQGRGKYSVSPKLTGRASKLEPSVAAQRGRSNLNSSHSTQALGSKLEPNVAAQGRGRSRVVNNCPQEPSNIRGRRSTRREPVGIGRGCSDHEPIPGNYKNRGESSRRGARNRGGAVPPRRGGRGNRAGENLRGRRSSNSNGVEAHINENIHGISSTVTNLATLITRPTHEVLDQLYHDGFRIFKDESTDPQVQEQLILLASHCCNVFSQRELTIQMGAVICQSPFLEKLTLSLMAHQISDRILALWINCVKSFVESDSTRSDKWTPHAAVLKIVVSAKPKTPMWVIIYSR